MSGRSVLIIGPGFIGWNILELLAAEGYNITGYVRRSEHGEQLKASGANSVVIGDLNDTAKITEQALEHDVVIHTATADHLPSALAVIEGIKGRSSRGKTTIFIHTSGTSVLDDNASGSHKTDKIYQDVARAEIDSVPDNAPHRQIDLAIVKAQDELGEKAKFAIMIPPLIYGFNTRHKRLTIQIPTLTRFALKHGFAGYVGQGLAVESNVHVLDLARAYVVLLHHLETSPALQTLENPYYFCETTGDDEPNWREVADVIGEGLHKAGMLSDPSPQSIDPSQYKDLFGEWTGAIIGLNSRSRAVRLRELGWTPREKDWRQSYLEDELPEILKETGGSFAGYVGIVPS